MVLRADRMLCWHYDMVMVYMLPRGATTGCIRALDGLGV